MAKRQTQNKLLKNNKSGLRNELRTGYQTIVVLFFLTALEYLAGQILARPLFALAVTALAKAAAIAWYFMHVFRLWSSGLASSEVRGDSGSIGNSSADPLVNPSGE